MVPANCTDRLQPLDVSVNKSIEEFLGRQFQEWYSDQVCRQLAKGEAINSVSLQMSVITRESLKDFRSLGTSFRPRTEVQEAI